MHRVGMLIVGLAMAAGCTRSASLPMAVTEASWERDVLQSDKPVLVDFSTTWCGPCRDIAPAVDQITHDYHGRVRVVQIDGDDSKSIVDEYKIQGFPTFIVFRNGKELTRQEGIRPDVAHVEQLKLLIDGALGTPTAP